MIRELGGGRPGGDIITGNSGVMVKLYCSDESEILRNEKFEIAVCPTENYHDQSLPQRLFSARQLLFLPQPALADQSLPASSRRSSVPTRTAKVLKRIYLFP